MRRIGRPFPHPPLPAAFILKLVLLLAYLAGDPVRVAAQLPTKGDGIPTLAPLLREVTPGVVNIATRGRVRRELNPLLRDPAFRRFLDDPLFRRFFNLPEGPVERETHSIGSGVIVDARAGHLLTNHHVIEHADEILVTLKDGRELEASLLGSDPETDIAVLKIEARDLRAVPLGDSDSLEVGDFVVAIGNPFALGQTVTSGIVSALGRSGLGIERYENFIQTDASINPGNSGGALIDLNGRLVGINTAIIGPSGGNIGIGFAIPVKMARHIMDQIVAHGEVRRGRMGVAVQDLTAELAQGLRFGSADGAVISEVVPSSAAARAGLRPGDIVVRINGQDVRRAADLRNRIGVLAVGDVARLEVWRRGKIFHLDVAIE